MKYQPRCIMRHPGIPGLFALFCIFVSESWPTVQAASACDDQLAGCGPSCVATERILNLYGLYGSASVLFLLPKTNSFYSLCYSRTTNTQPAISEIFCLTGRMDELQAVQPRYVTTVRGRCTNLQGFVADDSQYVIVFRESKEPMLHEVLLGQDRAVTFSFIHMVGSDGSTYAKITYPGSQGAVVATTGSRQYCHSGDGTCAHSHVYILSVDTLTQCTALQSIPGEHVAGWSDDGVAYYVFASDVPNTPDMFTLQLFRVSVLPTGDCLLEMMQEISFGQPLCGVRSLEIIRSFDARTFLLVASQRCAGGNYPSTEGNIFIKEWSRQAKGLIDSQSGRELPQTSSVVKITSVSPHFFICQRHSEPSTVNVPTLPLSAPVVSTIRIHNQAPINAVLAPNKDVFVTHVTSVGSVVVDWISCSLNTNQKPSNFSLTSYTGKRQDYSPIGMSPYEDAARMVGRPVYVPDPPSNPPGFLYGPQAMLPQHQFRQSVIPPPPPPRLSLPPSAPSIAPVPSPKATDLQASQQSPTSSDLAKLAATAAAVSSNPNRLTADNHTLYDHPEQPEVWRVIPPLRPYIPVRLEVPPQIQSWPVETGQDYAGPRSDPYQPTGPFYPPPPQMISFPPNPYGQSGLPYGAPQYPGMYPAIDYGNQAVNSPPNPYFPGNVPNSFGYPPRPYDNTLPQPTGYAPRYPVSRPQKTSYESRPEVVFQPTKLRHVIIPQQLPSAYSVAQPDLIFSETVNSIPYPVVPEQNATTEEPATIVIVPAEETTTAATVTTEAVVTDNTQQEPAGTAEPRSTATTPEESVVARLGLRLAQLITTSPSLLTATEPAATDDTTVTIPSLLTGTEPVVTDDTTVTKPSLLTGTEPVATDDTTVTKPSLLTGTEPAAADVTEVTTTAPAELATDEETAASSSTGASSSGDSTMPSTMTDIASFSATGSRSHPQKSHPEDEAAEWEDTGFEKVDSAGDHDEITETSTTKETHAAGNTTEALKAGDGSATREASTMEATTAETTIKTTTTETVIEREEGTTDVTSTTAVPREEASKLEVDATKTEHVATEGAVTEIIFVTSTTLESSTTETSAISAGSTAAFSSSETSTVESSTVPSLL
ncbi:hypothetical protein RvY_17172 [Ramazzottius varieornatus]|uniref:Sema domain-containing protein n=1 Tax=Ramazzottius varieornatus TaxID=947166 RepID=A0A1D1W242_RAMVA|nr:hypothetical protein RvY_17172 [Ramazzottius varieornatus]